MGLGPNSSGLYEIDKRSGPAVVNRPKLPRPVRDKKAPFWFKDYKKKYRDKLNLKNMLIHCIFPFSAFTCFLLEDSFSVSIESVLMSHVSCDP